VGRPIYARGGDDDSTIGQAISPRLFRTQLVIEPSPGQLSSDAGLLPLRQFDEQFGLTRAFADALDDPRDPALTAHTFLEMVRSRAYGILAGYADQNDHDILRAGPVFQPLANRAPDLFENLGPSGKAGPESRPRSAGRMQSCSWTTAR
jgi:hypothetical protein